MDPITTGLADSGIGSVGDAYELRSDSKREGQSRRLGAASDNFCTATPTTIDPGLLTDDAAYSHTQFDRRAIPKRGDASTSNSLNHVFIPRNTAHRVNSAPVVAFPVVTDSTEKVQRPIENPIIATPPPVAPAGSENAGGGGAGDSGGGGSSGSGRATQTAPVASTATPVSPSAAAVVPAVAAAQAVAEVLTQPPLPTSNAPTQAVGISGAAAQNIVQSNPTAASQSNATVGAATAATAQALNIPVPSITASGPVITVSDVQTLLDRAAAATSRNDAIIAVVDRNGQILGVRVEAGVPIAPNSDTMVFAIDGAVAKARTAAFFSNDSASLTSRTVRFISQSTITQREVQSNPNETDPTIKGPGFVAPIGLGGHFPPGVQFTPHVDLFAIEHTNRDSAIHAGANGIRENGAGDDVTLMDNDGITTAASDGDVTRFGADFVEGMEIPAPESYGFVTGALPTAQGRGIATLPGGVPLYKTDPATGKPKLVGGIGVFFPGSDGYATFEQGFVQGVGQTAVQRTNAPLVLQAEYMAFAAAGGVSTIGGIGLPSGFTTNLVRIDLAGITLEGVGPNPAGINGLLQFGRSLGEGSLAGGVNKPVNTNGDLLIDGMDVPEGWLVAPRGSGSLTADDVRQIIERGVAEANLTRAAIRTLGSRTRMVLSVTDTNGEVLGLYRMPDATFFSIDVAVAKARNVAYYADPAELQPEDRVDDNNDGQSDVPLGTAFTNRTFRYLASPFFPTGVDTSRAGDFSTLNDPGINRQTAENLGAPTPANQFQSVLGYDAFNPGTNFHELDNAGAVDGNQNGVVFFPGSTPLYKNGVLVGGFGVSGDGVDQDDVVTFGGSGQFRPQVGGGILRSDETFVRGVRLPFQKFSRNARA